MNVLFHYDGDDRAMLDALRARLPDVAIHRFPRADRLDDARDEPEPPDPASITDVVVWLPPAGFFDGLASLRRVHALSAGVDHLLEHPGLPAGATVLRLEDAGMAVPMAEYVLYGVLRAHRRCVELERAAREGRWEHEIEVPPAARFEVGILGAGVLARAVAERLVLNGYPTSCWSRSPRDLPADVVARSGEDGLATLLGTARALVCLLPLTDDTRGILDAALFGRLPRGAFLINPARGGHLVEEDLLAALDEGRLSGALLDVFAEEPLPPEHPFRGDPRIAITPHVAAPSQIAESVERVAANLEAVGRGETPAGVVDRTRGY